MSNHRRDNRGPKVQSSRRHRRRLARIAWAGRASRFILLLGLIVVATLWAIWTFTPATNSPSAQPTTITYATRAIDTLAPARVTRVIDGDTIDVLMDGQAYSLRYIGIDAPERGEAGFHVATQRNRQLLASNKVYLEKDESESDRYDRLVRYVYLPDGRMVNEILVAEGKAKAYEYWPDVKYADRFRAAEDAARAAEHGLWAP